MTELGVLQIHPRSKKPVGVRLAQGAAVSAYGKTGPVSGPTLSGCAVSGTKITVKFNTTLLSGGTMDVQDYFKGTTDPETGKPTGGSSMMQVLVNASAFCLQTHSDPILGLGERGHKGPKDCWDDGTGHTLGQGNYDSGEVRQRSPLLCCARSALHPWRFFKSAWHALTQRAGSWPRRIGSRST